MSSSNREVSSSEGQPSTTPPITASTLFDIINTIVTAANVDSPTHNEQEKDKGTTSETTSTPIQVQLHLNTDPSPPETAPLKSTKGRGKKMVDSQEKPIQPWHYHLGGVRQRRVPLSPEIKEALEVAYISRIMSKNFRKEGQPEKERISRITGLEIEKVHEWFKNRRKKDKLLQERIRSGSFTNSRRGRKKIIPTVLKAPGDE